MSDRRSVAWGWVFAWGLFVAYAAALAPPDDPALTRALVKGSMSGDFGGVDHAIAAVFSMLGVVPVLASTFVLRDGADRKLPAWPFALGMFVAGAFALLPWLALRDVARRAAPARPRAKATCTPLVRVGDRRRAQRPRCVGHRDGERKCLRACVPHDVDGERHEHRPRGLCSAAVRTRGTTTGARSEPWRVAAREGVQVHPIARPCSLERTDRRLERGLTPSGPVSS